MDKGQLSTLSPASPASRSEGAEAVAFHRSGAVAHMLRMPVATLRVWERRYALTQTALSPGGQRLYSADDVRRLALVKQLTDLGHAIGSLAPLGMAQLQHVAATHAHAAGATQRDARMSGADMPPPPAWRVAVIGAALATRLQRPALLRRLGRAVVLLGPFDDAAQAAAALSGAEFDVLLVQQPQLHDDWLATLDAAGPCLAGVPKAVLFGFAADPVCEALATAGTALLREPQPDAAVAQWLHGLLMASAAQQLAVHKAGASPKPAPLLAPEPVPPRRWDDAALAAFASMLPTVACECPRHVAELLVQLSHFETYSAECEHRSAADAELHAHLQQVAAASRTRFEAALEHVALHEGLVLPSPSAPSLSSPPRRKARAVFSPAQSAKA